MKLRNTPFLTAVGVSLLIHLSAIPVSLRIHTGGHPVSGDLSDIHSGGREMQATIVELPPEPKLPEPSTAKEQPAPEPPEEAMRHTEDAPAVEEPEPSDLEAVEVQEPEPLDQKAEEELPEFPIGEAGASGYASNPSPGERQATARRAESDQAFLSRDPAGTNLQASEPTTVTMTGENGRGGTAGAPVPTDAKPQPLKTPAGQQAPIGSQVKFPDPQQVASRLLQWAAKLEAASREAAAMSPIKAEDLSPAAPKPSPASADRRRGVQEELAGDKNGELPQQGGLTASRRRPKIAEAPIRQEESLPRQPDAKPSESFVLSSEPSNATAAGELAIPETGVPHEGVDPTAPDPSPIVAQQVGSGDGRAPGADRPAADPAPVSDTDSDPFSTLGSVNFRDGRVDVRAGRKIKAVRPKLTLAGKVDVFSMQPAKVELNVSIDASGKVTGVKLAKSSGSNAIDQPCLRAMYDWWFEPKKDARGNPMAERFKFTIVWH